MAPHWWASPAFWEMARGARAGRAWWSVEQVGATVVGLELTVPSALSRRTCSAVFGQVGARGPPSSHLGLLSLTPLAASSPCRPQWPRQVSRTGWPLALCVCCRGGRGAGSWAAITEERGDRAYFSVSSSSSASSSQRESDSGGGCALTWDSVPRARVALGRPGPPWPSHLSLRIMMVDALAC